MWERCSEDKLVSQECCREMLRLERTSGNQFVPCSGSQSSLPSAVPSGVCGHVQPGHPQRRRSDSLCSHGFQSVPISSFSVCGAAESSVAPSLIPPVFPGMSQRRAETLLSLLEFRHRDLGGTAAWEGNICPLFRMKDTLNPVIKYNLKSKFLASHSPKNELAKGVGLCALLIRIHAPKYHLSPEKSSTPAHRCDPSSPGSLLTHPA